MDAWIVEVEIGDEVCGKTYWLGGKQLQMGVESLPGNTRPPAILAQDLLVWQRHIGLQLYP